MRESMSDNCSVAFGNVCCLRLQQLWMVSLWDVYTNSCLRKEERRGKLVNLLLLLSLTHSCSRYEKTCSRLFTKGHQLFAFSTLPAHHHLQRLAEWEQMETSQSGGKAGKCVSVILADRTGSEPEELKRSSSVGHMWRSFTGRLPPWRTCSIRLESGAFKGKMFLLLLIERSDLGHIL